MESILISVNPKHCKNIIMLNKVLEIRKSYPKCDLPIDVYIYCTKEKGLKNRLEMMKTDLSNDKTTSTLLNGKVVAKFTLNKVEEIKFDDKDVQSKACLSEEELFDYLFVDTPYNEDMRKGYAWHIDDLVIFDTPKVLSEFYRSGCKQAIAVTKRYVLSGMNREERRKYHIDIEMKLQNEVCYVKQEYRIHKPPQSWCYVETFL